MLAALGLAGLGLAIFQAPNNAILGAGFAGAGVGGLRAFVPFDARRQIYASGQKAIICSAIALSLGAAIAIPKSDLASKDGDNFLRDRLDAQRSFLENDLPEEIDLPEVSKDLNAYVSPL